VDPNPKKTFGSKTLSDLVKDLDPDPDSYLDPDPDSDLGLDSD
jgi:hypothetical protein